MSRAQRVRSAETSARANYTDLVAFYERFFEGRLGVWQRARRNLLRRILPHARLVCDLACGTGRTAVEFVNRGLQVFAVDRSAAMCRATRRKTRQAKVSVDVIQADMRRFRLPQTVDLVTCEFHAINHLLSRRDLQRALGCVHSALGPGGHFYFDVIHRQGYEEGSAQRQFYEARDLALIKGYEFDRSRGRAEFAATWFTRRGRFWRRHDERIKQAPWSDAQVRGALRSAGFQVVSRSDAARFLPPADGRRRRGQVSFYLARKQNS